ncbi:MAG: CBS domain-containing protein [Rubricoccaceae bacterium]
MIVQSLLGSIPALATTDTVAHALLRMAEEGVTHLPVVGLDGRLEAHVSEEALRAYPDPAVSLGALLAGAPLSVTPDTHVFDAAHLMQQHGLGVLPVAAADGTYVGAVERAEVFGKLAHMLATEEPGAIVVLDVDRRNFSLAQLAHLIEQNGVRVLSVSTEDDPGAGRVTVTLKLNVTDTARVRHLMAHHDYHVTAVFDEAEDDLEARVAAFMRYLDV